MKRKAIYILKNTGSDRLQVLVVLPNAAQFIDFLIGNELEIIQVEIIDK